MATKFRKGIYDTGEWDLMIPDRKDVTKFAPSGPLTQPMIDALARGNNDFSFPDRVRPAAPPPP